MSGNYASSLRWFCERRQMSAGDQAELQNMLNRYTPRFDPDVRDVLRWRLRAHFELVAERGNARDAANARLCLLRFQDTDVATLQRCALAMKAP